MKNKPVVLAVIAIVVVVGVVAAIALGGNDTKKSDTSQPSNDSMSNMDTNKNSSASSASATEAVATQQVEIEDYSFKPQVIKVKVGDKVTWTNKDSVQHDVMADDGVDNGPSSDLLGKGESYSFTFTKVGTYTYHCTPHPYMKATVIVE